MVTRTKEADEVTAKCPGMGGGPCGASWALQVSEEQLLVQEFVSFSALRPQTWELLGLWQTQPARLDLTCPALYPDSEINHVIFN